MAWACSYTCTSKPARNSDLGSPKAADTTTNNCHLCRPGQRPVWLTENRLLPFQYRVRFWPLADICSCSAHVRFRGQSRHDLLRESAFAVAIGGKADIPKDPLHVLDPRDVLNCSCVTQGPKQQERDQRHE